MDGILLGYPDDVDATTSPTFADNFLGGKLVSAKSLQQLSSHPFCICCGKAMSFLLQLYCPVGGASTQHQHRNLFFFACLASACQKSDVGSCWRVFRMQQQQQVQPERLELATDWGFGDDNNDADDDNSGAGLAWLQPVEESTVNVSLWLRLHERHCISGLITCRIHIFH